MTREFSLFGMVVGKWAVSCRMSPYLNTIKFTTQLIGENLHQIMNEVKK